MTNENETVDQVCEEMKEVTGTRRFIDSHYCNHCGDQIDGEGSTLDVYSDRILEAHKREMDGLRTLVKELADALEEELCDFDCETNGKCRCPADMKREECESFNMRPLVARAREVIK